MTRRSAWLATLVIVALLAGCGAPPQGWATPIDIAASVGPVADDFAGFIADNTGDSLAELGVPGATGLDAGTAYLQGPHFHYAVQETVEATSFEPTHPDRLRLGDQPFVPIRAGTGLTLLVVRLHSPSPANAAGEQTAVVTARVIVAGRVRDLGPLTQTVDKLLAISLTARAPVSLVISDSGRDQSIDLRTGNRRPDAVAGYYPVSHDTTRLSDVIEVPGATRFELTVTVRGTRYPYVAGQGWAESGRAWLDITLSLGTTSDAFRCDLDAARSLTVAVPAGQVPVPTGTLVATNAPGATEPSSVTVVLDVPEVPILVQVEFVTEGTCRGNAGGTVAHQRFDAVNAGTVTVS